MQILGMSSLHNEFKMAVKKPIACVLFWPCQLAFLSVGCSHWDFLQHMMSMYSPIDACAMPLVAHGALTQVMRATKVRQPIKQAAEACLSSQLSQGMRAGFVLTTSKRHSG